MSCSISVPAAESSVEELRQKQFTAKNKQAEFDLQFEASISRHIRSGLSQSTINFPDILLFFPPLHPPLFISSISQNLFYLCVCSLRAGFGLKKPLKMNMVKRIMGRPRQEECSPQDNALGLMHLRRLFSELCHPPRHMTQKEQEEKLYMMLPVFNRVRERDGCLLKETASSSNMHQDNAIYLKEADRM